MRFLMEMRSLCGWLWPSARGVNTVDLQKVLEVIKIAHEFLLALEKQVPQIKQALSELEGPAKQILAAIEAHKD